MPNFVDHIDGDRSNNKIENLRECSKRDNNCNRGAQSNGKSGYKGVSKIKGKQKWESYISKDGKKSHLGRFNSPEDAAIAYDKKAIELHSDFAYTNFPKENYESV